MKAVTKPVLLVLAGALWLNCPLLNAQNSQTNSKAELELLTTVQSFLTDWLVRGDLKQAMRFVSASPVLGDCALPLSLNDKKRSTALGYRQGTKALLTGIMRAVPKGGALMTSVHPVGAAPPDDPSIQLGQPFDLFSLREFRDARFICKFDTSPRLRHRLAQPDVWYSTFALTGPGAQASNWIVAWSRERGAWRLVSIAPLED